MGMTTPGLRADALLLLAQVEGTAPKPYAALWLPYEGAAAILLAVALVVVAGGFAYAGRRVSVPLRVARPGGVAASPFPRNPCRSR